MCKADIGTFPPFELVEGFEAKKFSFMPIGHDHYAMELYSSNLRVYTIGDYGLDNAFKKGHEVTLVGASFGPGKSFTLGKDAKLIPRINRDIDKMLAAIDLPRLEALEAWHPVLWKIDTDQKPQTDARGHVCRGVALDIMREDFKNYYYRITHSDYARNHYWWWNCWLWRGRYAHDIDKNYYMVLKRGAGGEPELFSREELWRTQQIFVCEYPEKSLNDALQLVVRDDGGLQIREPGAIPVRAVELDPNQYLVYDAPVYQDDSWRASIYNPY